MTHVKQVHCGLIKNMIWHDHFLVGYSHSNITSIHVFTFLTILVYLVYFDWYLIPKFSQNDDQLCPTLDRTLRYSSDKLYLGTLAHRASPPLTIKVRKVNGTCVSLIAHGCQNKSPAMWHSDRATTWKRVKREGTGLPPFKASGRCCLNCDQPVIKDTLNPPPLSTSTSLYRYLPLLFYHLLLLPLSTLSGPSIQANRRNWRQLESTAARAQSHQVDRSG